ncbi:MAG TPA: SAM-dependent methyltransferase [Candidatus Thermoplasmatota archaeon]|nr:SAM-dependent methyltransferase [Candidatus Thermoplasmatota archaeon]
MKILDATCGFRGIWYQKNHPFVTFMDVRKGNIDSKTEGVKFKSRRRWKINPDVVSEWKDAPFPDNYFDMIIFDPPHILTEDGKTLSALQKEYGTLNKNNYKEVLKTGINKLFEILKPEGTFILKWCENSVPVNEIIKLVPYQPLFGSNTKSKGHTANYWIVFLKYRMDKTLEDC